MDEALPPLLLAEDDPNDILLLQRAFQKANVLNPVTVVRDGEDAVNYLSQAVDANADGSQIPVVMLLDLKLPRMSGLEVLEWVRSKPRLKRLPVVVFSASRQTADVNRAYDLGANSYLVKPVTFESLLEMVKALGLYWVILNQNPEL